MLQVHWRVLITRWGRRALVVCWDGRAVIWPGIRLLVIGCDRWVVIYCASKVLALRLGRRILVTGWRVLVDYRWRVT